MRRLPILLNAGPRQAPSSSRPRRPAVPGAAVTGTGGLVALCLVGALLASCGGPGARRSAGTGPGPASGTSPCRNPAASSGSGRVTAEDLAAVHFSSPADGVGLVSSSCTERGPVRMAVSHDGGATWGTTGRVLWSAASPFRERVVSTSTRQVWASPRDGPLLRTDDGGRRWDAQPVPAPVDGLAVAGDTVWALSCPPVDRGSSTCTPAVEQQPVGGGPWRHVPLPGGVVMADPTLDVVTPTTAVVLAFVSGAAPASAQRLLVTTDGGQQWAPRPLPDGPDGWCHLGGGTTFTAADGTTWWLLCNGGAAAGSSSKALLRSTDGGGSWTTVAEVADLQTPLPAGSLTRADTGNVHAGSPDLLWIASANALTVSTDGGRHWHDEPAVQLGGGGDLATFDVWSPTRAWLLEPFSGLWSTADGTTWRRLG